jgi:PAS domain S-box-containing protein
MDLYKAFFDCAPDATLVADSQGCIVAINAQAEKLFGYRGEELVGRPIETLIPAGWADRPMGAGPELIGRRRSGQEFPVDIMLSPVQTPQGRAVLGVVRDVTERQQVEAYSREIMRQGILLKEVHHRVKNILQAISSQLYLQSAYARDAATRETLVASQARVATIALLYEKLYRSEQFEKINMEEYLRDLVAVLFRTYKVAPTAVALHANLEPVRLGIDTALPCGRIVNELVSNVLKHAFAPQQTGQLWIDLHAGADDQLVLTLRDNGVGLPRDFDWQESKSMGLKMVWDMTRQLGGIMEVDRGHGTTFRLTFAELHYVERR